MGQNRETKINLYIQGQLISNERAKNTQQGQDSFFNNGAGKLDNHTQKNETGCLSYTIDNNQLKMDERILHLVLCPWICSSVS